MVAVVAVAFIVVADVLQRLRGQWRTPTRTGDHDGPRLEDHFVHR